MFFLRKNGQGGIRTLDTPRRILVFETSAFNRSATCPENAMVLALDAVAYNASVENIELPLIIERTLAVWMIVVGLSHLFQARLWSQFVLKGEEHLMIAMLAGLVASAFGTFIVVAHPWDSSTASIITCVLGWMMLGKGIGYMVAPDRMLRSVPISDRKLLTVIRVGGVVAVAIGGWLATMVW